MAEKISAWAYDNQNHARHQQQGWYVTSDYRNYISRDETMPPASPCIRDAAPVNYNHHHHHHPYPHPYGTIGGEKPVQKTDERAWVIKEHVHYSEENIDAEAEEFIQHEHRNFERSKMMPLRGMF